MNRENEARSYEALYQKMYERALLLHDSNKRRIRRGLIVLLALPAAFGFIRWVTGSDKIFFLIIWVIAMFVLCAYLITVEYLDSSIQKTIEDVTKQEAEFDRLIIGPEDIQERLHERIREIRAARAESSDIQDPDGPDIATEKNETLAGAADASNSDGPTGPDERTVSGGELK